jgi:hypothetical protein
MLNKKNFQKKNLTKEDTLKEVPLLKLMFHKMIAKIVKILKIELILFSTIISHQGLQLGIQKPVFSKMMKFKKDHKA